VTVPACASGALTAPEGAFWIGSDHPFDLHECYLNFRADLDLPAVPGRALLQVAAASRYRLWINGQFVGRGPERSWPTSMAVDARDVTALLRPECNRIAVQVYSPGYSHFAHVHRAASGLICWLQADGKTCLVSDRHWRVQRDLSWSPLVPRVSIYGTGAEQRDMGREADWQTADASSWAAARVVQMPEGPIWARLRPRHTPLLTEDLRALTTPWETRFGPTPTPMPPPTPTAMADPHTGLAAAIAGTPQATIPPVIPAGHTAIWIFDLGLSQVCVAGAMITGAIGDHLTISYAEKARDGGLVVPDPETYCRMRPTDHFALRNGQQLAEGFSLRGGRFVIYRLDSPQGGMPAPQFHVRLPRYPLQAGGLPDCGEPVLNAVAALCQRTTLACLQDGFVDSVWRESSQWLGDVVAQSFALAAISDDARPLAMAIEMAAEGAATDGILPSVLSGDVPAYVVTDYNFAWVELLAFWSRHPGRDDGTLVDRHWATLCRMLDRFEDDRGAGGLIRSQPGRRLFLDWSPMDRGEPNLTYNLRLLHALQLAADLAESRGRADAAIWCARAAQTQAALKAAHSGTDGWRESPAGPPASQVALAFLILTGTVTGPEAEALADRIAARSLDPDDNTAPGGLILASPFMHHYVFQALHHLNRVQSIRDIIALRWGRWVLADEASTWENWSIDFPDGSACHGFSAHPLGWLRLLSGGAGSAVEP
jgi:Bacterial alpha-L-rhamnosidase 6 hairpin glycosidase domain